jgi:hypothetical protein
MLIKMSKKPTHSALCHRWTIVHIFLESMSNIVQGGGDFAKIVWKSLKYKCFPLTVIYGNDAGFEI